MAEKKKLGLVTRLIIGIVIGLLLGMVVPEVVIRVLATAGSIFGSYLSFIIPLMIVSFVATGIGHLTSGGAGKLLAVTVAIAYCSTIVAGSFAYTVDSAIFPAFITSDIIENFKETSSVTVDPYIDFVLNPVFDVTTAIVLAFIFGIGIIALRNREEHSEAGDLILKIFDGFQAIINLALAKTILPLLPFYIGITFAKMSYTGEVWSVLRVFWKVFVIILILHLIFLVVIFSIAGLVSKRNPFFYMKNQIPGYITAVGTQSSAITIPVNVKCAEANGVSKSIREFVVPLCATIHLAGSTITITSCATGVLMMSNMPHNMSLMFPFILTLGVVMIAAPGAPGGAIMSALSFLPMIGIPVEGALASLMIALYLTQDSFGTACNVSGDNAIAVIVDTLKDKITGTKTQEEN
ncbi:MAG: dicarboxylate/amino acid:cation symporter [Peptococcaceae bacterium]|nr:dicarboxylate/amino acid:cation symporter [Peptococcaceae bacterium]